MDAGYLEDTSFQAVFADTELNIRDAKLLTSPKGRSCLAGKPLTKAAARASAAAAFAGGLHLVGGNMILFIRGAREAIRYL